MEALAVKWLPFEGNGHSVRISYHERTVSISHRSNPLGKGMNSTILPPSYGRLFFNFNMAAGLREGELSFFKLRLKIDLVSHPARSGVFQLVYIYIYIYI